MKIYLLRHGETIWNKEHRLQGRQDIPLASEGREQILRAAKYLAGTISGIDHILTSPLFRARESAEIVAKELGYPREDICQVPLFLERDFGVGEGLTYQEALVKYPDSDYPGMEPLDRLCERAKEAIQWCEREYPQKTLLVVAHGAIMKAILVALTNGRIAYFDETVWINNGSYFLLESKQKQWNISIHNSENDYAPLLLQ